MHSYIKIYSIAMLIKSWYENPGQKDFRTLKAPKQQQSKIAKIWTNFSFFSIYNYQKNCVWLFNLLLTAYTQKGPW